MIPTNGQRKGTGLLHPVEILQHIHQIVVTRILCTHRDIVTSYSGMTRAQACTLIPSGIRNHHILINNGISSHQRFMGWKIEINQIDRAQALPGINNRVTPWGVILCIGILLILDMTLNIKNHFSDIGFKILTIPRVRLSTTPRPRVSPLCASAPLSRSWCSRALDANSRMSV